MRVNKFLRVYRVMCPKDEVLEPERARAIIAEMKAVAKSPTAIDAREIVSWWPWDSRQEMDAWIRKARKLMEQEQEK